MHLLQRQLHPDDVKGVLATLQATVKSKGPAYFQRDARTDAQDVATPALSHVDRDCPEGSFHGWIRHALTGTGAKEALRYAEFDSFAEQKATPGLAEKAAAKAERRTRNESNWQIRRHILFNILTYVTNGAFYVVLLVHDANCRLLTT